MKHCVRRLLLSLLVLFLACAAAAAESLDFFEEALSVRTAEELTALADAHGIALEKVPEMETTYLCAGVTIGGIPAYSADVYIGQDDKVSLPLAYFLIPEEAQGSSLSPSPGETYDVLMAALTARYGTPYMTAITMLTRDSLWFFDGVALRLGYSCVIDGSSYLTLEFVRNMAGIGDPPIIGFKPGEAGGAGFEAAVPPGLTGNEYVDRLAAAAKLSGEAFQPSVLLVEMGDCIFFQTTYGDIVLNVTTDAETGRINCVTIPLGSEAEASLAMSAIFLGEQDMRSLGNLISRGGDAIMQVYEDQKEGYCCLRDGAYCYSFSYDYTNECRVLLVTIREPLSQAASEPTPQAPAQATPQPAPEAALAPDEIEAWALGCSAILAARNWAAPGSIYDPYLFGMLPNDAAGKQRAIDSLSSSWSCDDREKLIATILRMTDGGHNARFVEAYDAISFLTDEQYGALLEEAIGVDRYMVELTKSIGDKWDDKQIKAWDWFRMIHLAGWGYIAGYLDLEEAYEYMTPIIERLRAAFSSWDEAVDNYMDGYAWWSRTDVSESNTEYKYRLSTYEKLKDDKALFNPLVWGANFPLASDQTDSGAKYYTFNDNGDGTCVITGYKWTIKTGDPVIPGTINGLTVTAIADRAFSMCGEIVGTLTIPDSVTTIGERAFWGCDGLTGVNLPDSLVSIGNEAFASCYGLTGVNLPDNLTSIGSLAFEGVWLNQRDLPEQCDQHRVESVSQLLFICGYQRIVRQSGIYAH